MNLTTIASIAQIIALVWIVIFGSKTIIQLLSSIPSKKLRWPSQGVITNILLAFVVFIFAIYLPRIDSSLSPRPSSPSPTAASSGKSTSLSPTPTLPLSPTPTLSPTASAITSTTISGAIRDGEFPATIMGPAIVEWASPGCGIFKLNTGEQFTWQVGHYWIFPNQASLDHFYPSHLEQYRQKHPASECPEGRP